MPGNIGDHLIEAGSEKLLKYGGINFNKILISEIQHLNDGTLVIPGSGAWTNLFHEWLPQLVIESSERFSRVIILPSTYDIEVDIVLQALQISNVYPIAREIYSYNALKTKVKIDLAFDPALFYFDNSPTNVVFPVVERKDFDKCLVSLRVDKGSRLNSEECIVDHSINNDVSLTSANLDEFLSNIKNSEFVVTDRLHVVVAAVFMGIPVFAFESNDFKISRYFEFVLRDKLSSHIKFIDINWLNNNKLVLMNK